MKSQLLTPGAPARTTPERAATATKAQPRELACRVTGGIEVTLFWNADDNSTSVQVRQPASGETLLFTVAREQALDAFYHPFAHLPTAVGDPIPALDEHASRS
jgi:hypothetical protein